jgi:hypothetical protein
MELGQGKHDSNEFCLHFSEEIISDSFFLAYLYISVFYKISYTCVTFLFSNLEYCLCLKCVDLVTVLSSAYRF